MRNDNNAACVPCNMVSLIISPRYDFDLATGHSETGLKACTYNVQLRVDDSGVENVWLETPDGGTNWRLVELRPVSEG